MKYSRILPASCIFFKNFKRFKDQNKFNKHYHEEKCIFNSQKSFLKMKKFLDKKNYRSSLLNYLVNPNILEILKNILINFLRKNASIIY